MEDKVWKTALWNRSWDDLKAKKYNAEGFCQFSEDKGVHLEIPSGDLSLTRKLAETGHCEIGMESDRYEYLFGITQDGIYLLLIDAISNRVGLSFPGHTRESLEASTVLSSHDEFDPSIPISTADFEIEGLRKWLGLHSSPEIREDNLVIEGGRQNEVIDVYRSDRCAMTIHSGIGKIIMRGSGIRPTRQFTSIIRTGFLSMIFGHVSCGNSNHSYPFVLARIPPYVRLELSSKTMVALLKCTEVRFSPETR